MEPELVQISHTQVVMAFVATCIEATARLLGVSKTCADLHDKATGLYLYGDRYIADEFIRESQKRFC